MKSIEKPFLGVEVQGGFETPEESEIETHLEVPCLNMFWVTTLISMCPILEISVSSGPFKPHFGVPRSCWRSWVAGASNPPGHRTDGWGRLTKKHGQGCLISGVLVGM